MTERHSKEKLFSQPLDRNQSIAFICSFCLGDNLISLVTVNNLVRNGYRVDVYGDYAYQLRAWFPHMSIYPLMNLEQQQSLKNYGTVLHMYESELSKQIAGWHPNSIVLSHSKLYLADMTMVEIQAQICRQEFELDAVVQTNDLVPLAGLVHRKNKNRIVIHPTSSLLRKNWPEKKFLSLAKKLIRENFTIDFIVSPSERKDWLWVEQEDIHLPAFDSLSKVAEWIYESAYFIGNDSGIGHLASNLGIPTVSIILRKGVAKQWRPIWAKGRVVLSPCWVNPRPIKEKLWKIFTRVSHVKKAFEELVRESR